MTLRVGTIACLIALHALTIFDHAAADGMRSRVALVRTPSADRLLKEANTRLRAELSAAGFDVAEVESAPGDPRAEVERASEHVGSFATVSMARTGAGALADIWISDHVTGKTVVRRLSVSGDKNAAAILAIRALELLRASLLEVAAPPASSPPKSAPMDVMRWVDPTLKPEPGRDGGFVGGTALSAGVLGLHDLHEIGLALGPTIRMSSGIADRWFARLVWSGPLFSPDVSGRAGTATVRQHFLSLDLGWATEPRPLGVFTWIGAGTYFVQVTGAAAPPYRSTSDTLFSFLVTAGLGGIARIAENVAMTADVSIVGLAPKPLIAIADENLGPARGPSVGASLGLLLEL